MAITKLKSGIRNSIQISQVGGSDQPLSHLLLLSLARGQGAGWELEAVL